MVRQTKRGKEKEAMRNEMAEIIRAGAEGIKRPNLKTITPEDVGKIRMLPMNRVYCVACGVPLYVTNIGTDKKSTIQVADSVFTGGGNGCKHVNGGVFRNSESR